MAILSEILENRIYFNEVFTFEEYKQICKIVKMEYDDVSFIKKTETGVDVDTLKLEHASRLLDLLGCLVKYINLKDTMEGKK